MHICIYTYIYHDTKRKECTASKVALGWFSESSGKPAAETLGQMRGALPEAHFEIFRTLLRMYVHAYKHKCVCMEVYIHMHV